MKKNNSLFKKIVSLVISLAIPLIVGGISAALTSDAMQQFSDLNQPVLSPPGWLFPVVWTILYILMGISCWLVYMCEARDGAEIKAKKKALLLYFIQLFFNFCWAPLFFKAELYYVAFIWLLIMWVLILLTMICFYRIKRLAMYLLIPYLLWTTFAGYLNLMVAILNP